MKFLPALFGALFAAGINAGTAAIALWTQEGVTEFSDISQVAYGVVVMGALVQFSTDLRGWINRRFRGSQT